LIDFFGNGIWRLQSTLYRYLGPQIRVFSWHVRSNPTEKSRDYVRRSCRIKHLRLTQWWFLGRLRRFWAAFAEQQIFYLDVVSLSVLSSRFDRETILPVFMGPIGWFFPPESFDCRCGRAESSPNPGILESKV
jgi:hypothetical protein